MSATLLHIADLVLNRPLLIHPDKLALVAQVLDGRLGIDASALAPDASRFIGASVDAERGRALPYRRTPEGVAIVTVTGSLVNRGAWVGASSGITSYEGVRHQLTAAAADPQVRAILLDLESPGGQAVGAFELADTVRAIAAEKPVTAVVNGMAASAAYAIASGASRIVTTPTGISGSIGVVMLHADFSRALDKAGITPSLIHAGARKVDGHPYAPLSADVRADLQAEIDGFMTLFVETVAAGRKGLSATAIRATEARTFVGKEAVAAGLADAVGSFEDVLTDLARGAPGARRFTTSPTRSAAAMTTDEELTTRADERTRIKGILSHAEAEGRQQQALGIALETSLTVDEAARLMAVSPKIDTNAAHRARLEASGGGSELGPDASSNRGRGESPIIAAAKRRAEAARRRPD